MSALKSKQEMERIRAADAVVQEKRLSAYVTPKNEATPVAYFQVDRYISGSFRGLFVVSQLIVDDAQGKQLKKPIRKVVADGVDMVVAMSSLETALRKKVFR